MFQALAIKYRPKTFSELIGQDSISQTLSLALDTGRLGHAYLFSGLRGSGKTSSARIFAKSLNCDKGPTSTPCGECENCRAAASGRHLDIIEMDAASSRKIDDIRDLIEQTRYAPAMGRYKIFIIDEVHMLTKESYNALLKTLEEPPQYVKFILATTDVFNIPPTILSRTQHFRFKKIPQKVVVAHLETILSKENIEGETQALEMIARSGNGSLRDALTLLDQAIIYSKGHLNATLVAQMLGILDPEILQRFFDAMLRGERGEVFAILEMLEGYECEMVLEEMGLYLKDVLKDPNAPLSLPLLDRFFRVLTDSTQLLFLNANNSFVLTLTALKMLEAFKIASLDEQIAKLENELFSGSVPVAPSVALPAPAAPLPPAVAESAASDSAGGTFARELFAELVQKIYARSFELGQCFETHITFVSFENNELCWRSSASGACKERLRLAYSFIRMCVEDVYGVGTKIVPQKVPAGAESAPKPADSMPAPTMSPAPDSAPTDSVAPLAPAPAKPEPALSAPAPAAPQPMPETAMPPVPADSAPLAQSADSAPESIAPTAPPAAAPTHDAQQSADSAPALDSAPAPKPSATPTFEELKEEFPLLGKVSELLGIKHIDVSDVKQ
ncbi:MAG: DNA polymerase III subunit gamma/tau [Helicobacter sp.]|nr:DNA polymerase III subunit gamma/tau [Helicobacter sp.]